MKKEETIKENETESKIAYIYKGDWVEIEDASGNKIHGEIVRLIHKKQE